jgi:hypothetical protein
MPWEIVPVEFLLFLAVVYVFVVLVRAITQLWSWFKPRQVARLKRHPQSKHGSSSAHRWGSLGLADKILLAIWRTANPLGGLATFFKRLFTRKDYTYWVGLAAGEAEA